MRVRGSIGQNPTKLKGTTFGRSGVNDRTLTNSAGDVSRFQSLPPRSLMRILQDSPRQSDRQSWLSGRDTVSEPIAKGWQRERQDRLNLLAVEGKVRRTSRPDVVAQGAWNHLGVKLGPMPGQQLSDLPTGERFRSCEMVESSLPLLQQLLHGAGRGRDRDWTAYLVGEQGQGTTGLPCLPRFFDETSVMRRVLPLATRRVAQQGSHGF